MTDATDATTGAAAVAVPVAAPVDEPDHATTLLLRTDRREPVLVGLRARAAYYRAPPGRSCVRDRMRPGRPRPARTFAERSRRRRPAAGRTAGPGTPTTGSPPTRCRPRRGAGRPPGTVGAAARPHLGDCRLHVLCTDATGLSPERFARIERVRAVLAAGPGRWAEVAAAGHYDRAHLMVEFRRFTGVAPAACTD
ncbi:AraC family transcriptional regulator [Kitasatospora phosalacinea]|uniref:AraC family transcriptional regulator n=1 Tax=Kitasatospora phosalacinea TaxID=2065 RepID=UPI000AAD06AB|nr:AraC family transcriptional regulator [Kitasatospora phosalacinea]